MTPRELIVLSPYRPPAQNPLMLANDDTAALLNGYSALWHPAAVRGAARPPRIDSPYDHEQPSAGHVYAVPETPPLVLPDDWDQRVLDAGAVAFRATPDRDTTLCNLKDALRSLGWAPTEPEAPAGPSLESLLELSREKFGPFLGVGFGYLMVDTLFEAMEHENVLATAEVWQHVQEAATAIADPDADLFRRHLQSAADRLLTAREVLYSSNIHVIDLCLVDEGRPGGPLPAAFERGAVLNVVAAAGLLGKLGREHADRLAALRERFQSEQAEVCGGPYVEREDALLPVESQLWNLIKGLATYQELLGAEVRVFGRKRSAFHPQLPTLLNSVGLHRAILLAFDTAVVPTYRATVVNWPSPDGKQVEAFARMPHAADNPQTFFHLAHYLRETILHDHAATIALLHGAAPAAPWYVDWLELSRLGPVLGRWTTLTRYFNEVMTGEYASAPAADEFHSDYLEERTSARVEHPVSGFARHLRLRRRLDTAWSLAAMHRGLAGASDPLRLDQRLAELEDKIENHLDPGPDLEAAQQEAAAALADRLVSRARDQGPGYVVLNPCSFTRRVALELQEVAVPLPVEGPVKASQLDGNTARVVVEVPALGFAWIPRSGPPGAPAPAPRMRLADGNWVRNEFFEAEVDSATGGLRALRDHRTRTNRIGQQLVYNPGSTMRLNDMKITSAGPALGEIVSEGALLDEQEKVLATFRQRFRAWLGRPLLEMRVEIYPEHQPEGYPWHAYYGARFAWRDERATLLRGVNGTGYVSSHTRPETPDYLEIRLGRQSTVLFPGGLPFHQRQGPRMLDVVLLPEGETARSFELALGLDRELPMQTALGLVTPVPLVSTTKGPPHVGASGWLFHLDAPSLLLSSLRPGAGGADALVARMLECSAFSTQAEFRCARAPRRAELQDARGSLLMEAATSGDAVAFDVASGDLVQLRVEFS
jgi:hypothetical protein